MAQETAQERAVKFFKIDQTRSDEWWSMRSDAMRAYWQRVADGLIDPSTEYYKDKLPPYRLAQYDDARRGFEAPGT